MNIVTKASIPAAVFVDAFESAYLAHRDRFDRLIQLMNNPPPDARARDDWNIDYGQAYDRLVESLDSEGSH